MAINIEVDYIDDTPDSIFISVMKKVDKGVY